MSINLVTYANQTVTPTNDAIIYERAIDQNGIFHGCNVTVSSNNVNITGGYGIVCGREFVIESESIPVTLAPSGTNDGRLYVRLDLADADAPIQLLTDQGNPLPPLEQDTDVNYVNGAYEMELATFTVGVSALSDVVETFETITGSKEVPTEIADYVVEKGTTSSGWKYCKWNSGKIEAYNRIATTNTINTATGSIYTSPSITVSLPNIGINSIDFCSINYVGGEGTWVSRMGLNAPDDISFSFMSSISRGSAERYINIFIIGSLA